MLPARALTWPSLQVPLTLLSSASVLLMCCSSWESARVSTGAGSSRLSVPSLPGDVGVEGMGTVLEGED
jgi:hypothetical protein